ncbi:MAG TPA: hypothetical protein VMQ76_09620 [Terracidiphilus sp.]|nr:hypothetical protein [Terracidiphilus sp.]
MFKKYFNRTQLARRLKISQATLAKRILAGVIKPDANDDNGNPLFLESEVERYEAKEGAK